MAHKELHKLERIEAVLLEQIASLNMPGSLTQRINWFIREGIAAHPEIKRTEVQESGTETAQK